MVDQAHSSGDQLASTPQADSGSDPSEHISTIKDPVQDLDHEPPSEGLSVSPDVTALVSLHLAQAQANHHPGQSARLPSCLSHLLSFLFYLLSMGHCFSAT